ncbi:MAG TPA: hypothetical protein VFA26_10175 [Gemmataceae bacterium]|nr:hypothetical protein [Gemmataceae bacterium]
MMRAFVRFAGLALLPGLALAAGLRAQAPAGAALEKKYTRSTQFRLPLDLRGLDPARLQEVMLYVRTPTENWSLKDHAPPTQKEFRLTNVPDGEYWFTIVTVDRNGNPSPPEVSRQPPGIVVVVDTQPPEVELQVVPAQASGALVVRCEARDANLDPTRSRVEGQRADQGWQPLEPVPGMPGLFRFPGGAPAEGEWTGKVRCVAADRAGNVTTREADARLVAGRPAADAAAPAPRAAEPTAPLPRIETRSDKPVILTGQAAGQQPEIVSGTRPAVENGPASRPLTEVPAHPTAATAEAPAATPGRLLLNSTHAALEYRIDQVGPSGVGKVEVWLTKDGGQSWARLCEDTDKRSPVEFDLPGEGTYGVSLVVTNGNGGGDPAPSHGTPPDTVIEVDTTRPAVQLLAARPGTGSDAGSLVLFWTATDKNLAAEPISLYYAAQKEGPWHLVARGVRNEEGSYRWPVPKDAGAEFYFRIEAADQAGNVGRHELPERVVLDLSRPRGKVLGVTAGTPRPTPPVGN